MFTLTENLHLALCLDAVPTSTQRPVCETSNTASCGHPIYHNLNAGYNSPSIWTFISCCYVAPTTAQLTLQFAIQEDDVGYWLLDAVSADQGNGELIVNGGFESNLSNWTLLIYSNATSSTIVDNVSSSQYSGSAYLYGSSVNAPSYLQQTFSIRLGQNILISFWLQYMPAFGWPFGTSEFTATLF